MGQVHAEIEIISGEDLDILIDPLRQELVVNPKHPDFALHRL